MASMTFRRNAVALAVVGALGLGAVAADRVVAPTTAAVTAPAATPQVPLNARGLPSFADIVAQHGPAVVQIRSTREARKIALDGDATPNLPDGLTPFFRGLPDELAPFFRGQPGQPRVPRPGPQGGVGSGFIVSGDGILLTNAHVVANADEVMVKLTDQREFRAKVLGSDTATDIAVLKIEAKNLPVVKLGDPASTRVGDWVVAIGTPYGLDNTVTSGIVSAKSRALPGDGVVPFIQTDAAVNPGNSGGPLFNLAGEVVGINSQIFSRSGGFQGVAFAIPIDVAMNVADQIRTTGKVAHGRLGVTIQPVDQALADNFGLATPRGALVGSVQKDSPAARAGVEPGDIIIGFNGTPIDRSSELPHRVAATKPGSTAKLEIWRDGKARTLAIEIGTREAARQLAQGGGEVEKGKLGVSVRPLSAEERKAAKVERGVLVEDVGGPAARAGVRPGDVILSINRTPVDSAQDIASALDKSGKTAALLIQREDARIFVPVRIG